MVARVTIFRSSCPSREFYLDRADDYLIGRSPECNIRIHDPELSRVHARLYPGDGGAWCIEDLGSKNGVHVAGRAVGQAKLPADTWIGLGSLACRFELVSEAQQRRASMRCDRARQLTMQGKRAIDAAGDVGDVLRRLLSSVLSISATDRGFAMLAQPDGDLEVACTHAVAAEAIGDARFAGSRSAIADALRTRARVVTCDAAACAALANRASIVAGEVRALVCLPLVVFDRLVGLLYADSTTPGKFFTDLDLGLLEELADHAAMVIAAARLGEELDGVDREIGGRAATALRLARARDRLPSAERPVEAARGIPMTGVFWSRVEARA